MFSYFLHGILLVKGLEYIVFFIVFSTLKLYFYKSFHQSI